MKTSLFIYGFIIICITYISNHIVRCQEDNDESDQQSEPELEDDSTISEEAQTVKRDKPYFVAPNLKEDVHFSEFFQSESDFKKKWVLSRSKKEDGDKTVSKYDGVWSVEEFLNSPLIGDHSLVLKSKAKHHAVSSLLKKPFEFTTNPFVIQYEVKFQEGQDCGGAYVKLLTKTAKMDLINFNDKTPYTIMFGPDKCGNDNKLHFIFRHKNPITGEVEEKHAKKPTSSIDHVFTDKKTHLFTLVVKPDNTFEIYVDQSRVNYGSLLEDMTPAVNPPKEITDPNDKKPESWDDRERIVDPDAVKPEDWNEDEPEMVEDVDAVKPTGWLDDEPELIPDPKAEKPSDWDEDMDGEWEAPMINNPICESAPGCGKWKRPDIKNPIYKGKWDAPVIDNPKYIGKWIPKTIPNPGYFEDNEPFKMTTISAIGLELWSMSNDIIFDNFLVTDSKAVADEWASQTWTLKYNEESYSISSGVMQSLIDATHERPWLWAVIIVVIILPIVLIIAYCCMSTPKEADPVGNRKKTDESTEADQDEGEDDEQEEKPEYENEEGDDEIESKDIEGEELPDDKTKEGGDGQNLGKESPRNKKEESSGEKVIKRKTKGDLEI